MEKLNFPCFFMHLILPKRKKTVLRCIAGKTYLMSGAQEAGFKFRKKQSEPEDFASCPCRSSSA